MSVDIFYVSGHCNIVMEVFLLKAFQIPTHNLWNSRMHNFCPWQILKKSLLQKRTAKPHKKQTKKKKIQKTKTTEKPNQKTKNITKKKINKNYKKPSNPAELYMLYDGFKTNDTRKCGA